jgi:hypothetical protein
MATTNRRPSALMPSTGRLPQADVIGRIAAVVMGFGVVGSFAG